MKTKEQIQTKLNELIEYANAVSKSDHAKLGAMLLSTAGAMMCHGGASLDDLKHVIDVGFFAASKAMRS